MKLINKIKKAEQARKDEIFLLANLDTTETNDLLTEIAKSLPKAAYSLRGQNNNLIAAIYESFGNMISLSFLNESFWLGMQIRFPKRYVVSFTHDMDSVKII